MRWEMMWRRIRSEFPGIFNDLSFCLDLPDLLELKVKAEPEEEKDSDDDAANSSLIKRSWHVFKTLVATLTTVCCQSGWSVFRRLNWNQAGWIFLCNMLPGLERVGKQKPKRKPRARWFWMWHGSFKLWNLRAKVWLLMILTILMAIKMMKTDVSGFCSSPVIASWLCSSGEAETSSKAGGDLKGSRSCIS